MLAKLYQSDWTLIYSNFHEFNLAYYLLAIPLVFILHDFYFYWTHRLLHTKWLFKKVHLIHHNSTNPTPLTSLAFHPIEAIIQGAFLPLVVMLIPLHVSVVIILVAGSYIYNVIGHLGYEFYPKGFPEHPFWGLFLTATHHSHHHKSTNFNFGLYFTFWDRLMDTTIPNYFGIFDAIVSPRETRGAG
ncbi:MAG: sterol desaturase family protein [Bdellovibrionales bacterium]|nr:sterol desaturase family protein [Bdellovibrionales bacterium]